MARQKSDSVKKGSRFGGFLMDMKKVISRIFKFFGLELRRLKPRRATLAGALEYIKIRSREEGFEPKTVIDIGVAEGTPELYSAFPDSQFLLVEPLQEFEENLKKLCRRYDARYKIAAASSQTGKTVIHITPDLFGSSILVPKEDHLEFEAREIPTVTVDNLVDEFQLQGPYVIKIDAQSSELFVLQGASKTIQEAEILVLETPFFQFVEKGPQFYDIVSYLKEFGFVVYDIVGHNYRPLDHALAEVDLVFVKENGVFRRFHLFATPEQRNRQFARPNSRSSRPLKNGKKA